MPEKQRRQRGGVINPGGKDNSTTPARIVEANQRGRRLLSLAGVLVPTVIFSALLAENQGLTDFHEPTPQSDYEWLQWASNRLGIKPNSKETALWFENDFASFPNIPFDSPEAKNELERRIINAYDRMAESNIPVLSGTTLSLSNHISSKTLEFRPSTALPANAPFDQSFEELNGKITAIMRINFNLLQNGTTLFDLAYILVRGVDMVNSRFGIINQLRSSSMTDTDIISAERERVTSLAERVRIQSRNAQIGARAYISVFGSGGNVRNMGNRSFLDRAFFAEAARFARSRMEPTDPLWQEYIHQQPIISQ